MKPYVKLFAVSMVAAIFLLGSCTKEVKKNNNYMWVDCEANYAALCCPDSIRLYIEKSKALGFDNVVVDVKSIMGEVLYDSEIAPYMGDWEGAVRSRDYDMLGYFIEYGHELGVNVFASLNVFAGGHKTFSRGLIYGEHPEWQSICYHKGELMPIADVQRGYNGMLNPSNPEVQEYQTSILKEVVQKYPELDGIIFDRVRYDGMTADFSELSKSQFEAYADVTVENFPEDILSWYDADGNLRSAWARGPLFNKWCEWRAMVIHDFVSNVHKELKDINPNLKIGDYTGAWYPTYYELGVNWASKDYDPSVDFDWATPDYKNAGYAEQLDIYMTGLYYTMVTKEDIDNATEVKGENGEDGLKLDLTYCYSVEGGAELAKTITRGVVPVIGSIYVEQYLDDMSIFGPAVVQALKSTEGVMIFDIVHLNKHHLWGVLESAMHEAGVI